MPMQGYDKVKVGDVEFIEGGTSRPSGYGFVITDFRGSRPVLSIKYRSHHEASDARDAITAALAKAIAVYAA